MLVVYLQLIGPRTTRCSCTPPPFIKGYFITMFPSLLPIHLAARSGNLDKVKRLIMQDPQVKAKERGSCMAYSKGEFGGWKLA